MPIMLIQILTAILITCASLFVIKTSMIVVELIVVDLVYRARKQYLEAKQEKLAMRALTGKEPERKRWLHEESYCPF